jgi:ankyrin repeat protein
MYHHDVQRYCRGRPPLHYAIDFGIPFLIKALIPGTSQVDTLYNGMAALHEAARCGDLDTCVTLLNLGASQERKSGPNAKYMTALHFAAEGGHSPVIQLLLAKGASPHAQSSSQSTPFYRAARSGSLEALRILYSAGSDIDAKTWDDWTALFEAVARGLVHIASQLLEWGADPTITTHAGVSALMLISVARHRDQTLHSSSEDIMVNTGSQPDLQPNYEEREVITLQEIRKLQAQVLASTNKTGNSFYEYLANLDQRYWRPERMKNETMPSVEQNVRELFDH